MQMQFLNISVRLAGARAVILSRHHRLFEVAVGAESAGGSVHADELPLGSHLRPHVLQTHVHVLERVQQNHRDHHNEEAAGIAHNIGRAHVLPLLEQDCAGGDDKAGEHDVVDRRDDGSGEDVQRLVEIIHLDGDEHRRDQHQDVRQSHPEVIVTSGDLIANRQAQRLAGHDGETADGRAEKDVDDDVLVTRFRSQVESDERGDGDDDENVNDESPVARLLDQHLQVGDLRFLRRVDDDDRRSDDAEKAAQLP